MATIGRSLRRQLDTLERCPTCGHRPRPPADHLPDLDDPDGLDKFQEWINRSRARLDAMQRRLDRIREATARGKTCAT